MESIIRAAPVAATPRQLRRPVVAVGSNLLDNKEHEAPGGTAAGGRGQPPGVSQSTPGAQTAPTPVNPAAGHGAPQAAGGQAARSYAPGAAQTAPVTPPAVAQDDSKAVYERELARLAEAQQQQQSAQNLQLQKQRELELQQARAAAEKLGFTEGLEQGAKAAQEVLQQHVAQLAALMSQLKQAREEMVERSEDTMVEIVYEALCRIAGENVGQKPMVLGMVQQVLREFRQHEPLVLLLHPQDLALVQHALPELGINPEQTQLRADPSLKMGGCLIESAAGTLDASLETQFSRLRDALLQVRRGEEYAGEMS